MVNGALPAGFRCRQCKDREHDRRCPEDLLYAVDDGIARLTFNRPDARNALTFAMYERMAEICQAANDDRSIKVMILTGAGDKAFAVGHRHLAVPRLQDRAGCA